MSHATALTRTTHLVAAQGEYDDAKPLYERSLAIREKVLGPDHPGVATGLNNLAELLKSQVRVDRFGSTERSPLSVLSVSGVGRTSTVHHSPDEDDPTCVCIGATTKTPSHSFSTKPYRVSPMLVVHRSQHHTRLEVLDLFQLGFARARALLVITFVVVPVLHSAHVYMW